MHPSSSPPGQPPPKRPAKSEEFSLTRRSFLLSGVGSLAALTLAALPKAPQTVDWLNPKTVHRALPEEFLASACGDCSAGCSLLLRKVGSQIVGVRPLEPRPCLRAYSLPQQLVHPDRIRTPMERDGARGSDRWKTVKADKVEQQLARLLTSNQGRTAVLIRADGELASMTLGLLASTLSAPKVCRGDWLFADGPVNALQAATGYDAWEPDLAGASGLITFGFDFLQSLLPPVQTQEAMRQWQSREIRAETVSVGPRLDLTALKADEWLPCRVGREPLVALTMAALLLKHKGYHESATSLPGFDALVTALAKFDVAGACEQAQVKVATIQRLTEYLADRRWLCLGPRRRLVDQQPVALLNALLGRVDQPGGWQPQPQLQWKGSSVHFSAAEEIPPAIEAGQIDLVLIYGENPAFTAPEPGRWLKALRRARHVVVFADTYNETARVADLVLPIPPPAERTARFVSAQGGKVDLRSVAPVMDPLPDCRDPLELFAALGQRLKEKLSAPIPTTPDELGQALEVVTSQPKPFALTAPQWQAPAYTSGWFHLLFETPTGLLRMTGGHLPYLITTVSPHLRSWWETTVELNPETARKLGIAERQLVKLSSEVGTIHARAKIYSGLPTDAVCVPLGLGHTLGAFAGQVGGNPAELVKFVAENHLPLWEQTKVNVEAL